MTNNPYELYHTGLGWDASVDTDFLAHYGVLGMKWGVRRYQNYDGTYTQRGLEKYNKASNKYEALRAEYKQSKDKLSRAQVKQKQSRAQVKQAKRDKNDAYARISTYTRIDKGQKLAEKNETALKTAAKYVGRETALGAATLAALKATDTLSVTDTSRTSIAIRGAAAVASLSNLIYSSNRLVNQYAYYRNNTQKDI